MLTPSLNFRIVIKTSMNFYSSNQNIYEFLFWPIYFLNFGQLPNQYIYQSTVNKLIANSRERHVGIKITKKFSLKGRENIKDQFRERETIVKKAITTAASSLQCCSSTIAQSSYSPFGFFFSFFLFFCFSLFFQSVQYFFFVGLVVGYGGLDRVGCVEMPIIGCFSNPLLSLHVKCVQCF